MIPQANFERIHLWFSYYVNQKGGFFFIYYEVYSHQVFDLYLCIRYGDIFIFWEFFVISLKSSATPPWARDRGNSFTFEAAASQCFQWNPANLSLSRWRIISHQNVPDWETTKTILWWRAELEELLHHVSAAFPQCVANGMTN